MISNDFYYEHPKTIEEAVKLFEDFHQEGKNPVYFSGGTEIITLGRLNLFKAGAVIDIKGIPECNRFDFYRDKLFTGAANTLTSIEEINHFPLLSKTASEIADRTARNKISVGGNICGQIFYREAVLPFLLTDSEVVIGSKGGLKTLAIQDIFIEQFQLNLGEFLVQLITNGSYLELPFVSIKRRRQWSTGYPLITVAAITVNQKVRVAISGLAPYPFRATQIEEELNGPGYNLEQKIDLAISRLNVPVLDDSEGSDQYRLFVLRDILYDVMAEMGGKA